MDALLAAKSLPMEVMDLHGWIVQETPASRLDGEAEGDIVEDLGTLPAKLHREPMPGDRLHPPAHIDALQVVDLPRRPLAQMMIADDSAEAADHTDWKPLRRQGSPAWMNQISPSKPSQLRVRLKVSLNAREPIGERARIVIRHAHDIAFHVLQRQIERLNLTGTLDEYGLERKTRTPARDQCCRFLVLRPQDQNDLIGLSDLLGQPREASVQMVRALVGWDRDADSH
jgi:hypothetical protein